MKYVVWVATDAFLYLPIYAMKDLGVLTRISSGLNQPGGEPEIEIRQPTSGEGDAAAIAEMILHAKGDAANPDIVHLAVADPLMVVEQDGSGTGETPDCRVLGGFVKRPPFYVLGRVGLVATQQMRVVAYPSRLATGSFLGTIIKDKLGSQKNVLEKSFGKEVDELFENAEEAEHPGTLRVVSADILGITIAMDRDPTIRIFERFNNEEDFEKFVTTGVLTWNYSSGTSQYEALTVFMQALRSATTLLQTADAPTAYMVQALSKMPQFQEQVRVATGNKSAMGLTLNQAKLVAKRLFDDKIYECPLALEKNEWDNTINKRAWNNPERQKSARTLFHKVNWSEPGTSKMKDWLRLSYPEYHTVFERNEQAERFLVANSGPAMVMASAVMLWSQTDRIDLPGAIGAVYSVAAAFAFLLSLYFSFFFIVRRIPWTRRIFSGRESESRTKIFENFIVLAIILLIWTVLRVFGLTADPDFQIWYNFAPPIGMIAVSLVTTFRNA